MRLKTGQISNFVTTNLWKEEFLKFLEIKVAKTKKLSEIDFDFNCWFEIVQRHLDIKVAPP